MSGNFPAGTAFRLLVAVLLVIAALPATASAASPAAPRGAGSGPARVTGTGRSVDFDQDWRFALVNPAGTTDPTGAYAHAADPGSTTPPGAA